MAFLSALMGKKDKGEGTGNIDPEVALSEELLNTYDEAREPWARQFWENNLFRNGVQLTEKQIEEYKARRQSPVVWNQIRPALRQKKALLTANNPSYQTTAKEDSDVNTAALITDCLGHVWYVSDGSGDMKEAVDDVGIGGLGYMMAYSDPNADWGKGEVFVTNVPALDVYVDPNSKDRHFKDAEHILIAKRMTEAQLIAFMPGKEALIKSGKLTESEGTRYPDGGATTDIEESGRYASQDQQLDVTESVAGVTYYEVIDRYTKIKQQEFRVYDPQTNFEKIFNEEQHDEWLEKQAFILHAPDGDIIITSPQGIREYLVLYEEVGDTFHFMQDGQIMPGEEDEGSVPNSTHRLELTTMGKLVSAEKLVSLKINVTRDKRFLSAGGQKLHEKILPIDEYPIVPFMEGHNRNPYPVSTTTLAKGIQEQLNKTKSLLNAYLANATNLKVFIGTGTQNKEEIRTELSKAGAAIIEVDYDIGPEPKFAGPVPIPSDAYREVQDARNEIYHLYGVYPYGAGDPQGAPETYRGGLLLDEHQQRVIGSQLNDFYESLNQLAKVTIQLIQNTYTEKKAFRLFQPSNKPKDVELNTPVYDEYTHEVIGKLNDVTVGKYDVITVAGSTLPSQRWATREYYMELYKNGLGDEEMVLRESEIRDVELILARKSKLAQAGRMLEEAQGEIKKLRGDLQTAERESTHSLKRVELEKHKGRLKEDEIRAHQSTLLFEERLNDFLKNIRAQA